MSELDKIIEMYTELKEECDKKGKVLNKLNTEIKSLLSTTEKYENDNYVVSCKKQERTSIDTDKIIPILKEKNLSHCIKLVENVDENNLKEALFNGLISQKDLKFAEKVTVVTVLKVNKRG
jgi:hypothetical protein